jgi:hypothetical protein
MSNGARFTRHQPTAYAVSTRGEGVLKPGRQRLADGDPDHDTGEAPRGLRGDVGARRHPLRREDLEELDDEARREADGQDGQRLDRRPPAPLIGQPRARQRETDRDEEERVGEEIRTGDPPGGGREGGGAKAFPGEIEGERLEREGEQTPIGREGQERETQGQVDLTGGQVQQQRMAETATPGGRPRLTACRSRSLDQAAEA